MRNIFLVLATLLLGLTWAAAQSSPNSGSEMGAGQSATAGQTSVEGCLSGSSGNFTLTDKNGMSYQLTGDAAKLSEHVGHEIKVTGTASSGAGATGGQSASSTGAGANSTIEVSSVKHISKTCKSGGMAH